MDLTLTRPSPFTLIGELGAGLTTFDGAGSAFEDNRSTAFAM